MAEIKIKGDISGSTTIKAPDSGSDEVIELSTVLGGKAPLDSPTFTGTPALPSGTTLAGAALTSGKILQIVRATNGSNFNTTSTSLVDVTGMSVTITPISDTSVIYIFVSFTHSQSSGSTNTRAYFSVTDSSDVALSGTETIQSGISTNTFWGNPVTVIAYDAPASTSAQTYKLRARTANSAGTTTVANSSQTGQLIAIEVAA